MTSTFSRGLAALALLISCGALQACSEDDEPTSEPTASAPTGSPFSATLEGPDVAAPGDQVTATMTNTGRLPDRYRFVASPEGGATITPPEVGLAPDQSVEVTIEVATSPVVIQVESLGAGGSGSVLTELSIGASQ